jgi:hypothetical protein
MEKALKNYIDPLQTPCQQRLIAACARIHRFGEAMDPYFGIIAIFVPSHIELAGVAWGSIYLVFQVMPITLVSSSLI